MRQGYKLILMGNQESTFEDHSQSAAAPLGKPLDSPRSPAKIGKYPKCQPYLIAEAANQAYQQLVRKFAGSKYLDLKPPAQSEEVEALDGHYRLSNLNACYNGEWKDGQPHGRGLATLANGSLLVGTFSQGFCMGDLNYFFFKDGSCFEGNIIGNRIAGNGKLTTKTLVYEGEWHDNLPHGKGTEIYANGDRYTGGFEKGVKQGEDCTFTWANHSSYLEYKGAFWGGCIRGEGKLTLRNKSSVEGYFQGKNISNLTLATNRFKFTGKIEACRPTGKGVLELYETRQCFNGNFKEGKLYGPCKVVDSKQRQNDAFFFEGRQFKKMVGLSDAEALRITKIVEGAYSHASRHSEALSQISQDLQEFYECRFVQPYQNIFRFSSYVALNVHDKVLLVGARKP